MHEWDLVSAAGQGSQCQFFPLFRAVGTKGAGRGRTEPGGGGSGEPLRGVARSDDRSSGPVPLRDQRRWRIAAACGGQQKTRHPDRIAGSLNGLAGRWPVKMVELSGIEPLTS